MLGVSNYTMQCLSSPTRDEVDRAHAHNKWLDIGVPSARNLSKIRTSRAILWGLLAVSSVPVHFFYNSVIFKTLDSNLYSVVVANADWLKGKSFGVVEPHTAEVDTLSQNQLQSLQLEFSHPKSGSHPFGYQYLNNRTFV